MTQPLEPRLPELNVGQIVGRNGWDLTFQNRVGLGEELGPLGLVELESSLIDQGDEFLVGEVHVPVVVDEDLFVPVVGVDVVRVPGIDLDIVWLVLAGVDPGAVGILFEHFNRARHAEVVFPHLLDQFGELLAAACHRGGDGEFRETRAVRVPSVGQELLGVVHRAGQRVA